MVPSDSTATATRLRLYEAVLEATPDLVYIFDRQHRFIYANNALLAMWGLSWDEAIGKTCLELGYEPWHAAMHDAEIEQVVATRQPIRGDVPFPHKTKGVRIYDYIFTPVIGPDGEVEAIAGSTRDVTERKQHEQRMRLLVNELNHRVKNTLSVVQSMVLQTLRNGSDAATAQERIESRLVALSDTHDLLTRKSWEGARVGEIVHVAIAPCRLGDDHRFQVEGPGVLLDPRRAVALAMALHELCTNAMKYGALSVPQGRVSIRWTRRAEGAGSMLNFLWQESGGPPVLAPARRGFGSRLVERGLKHDLGGESRLIFAPGGVSCQIAMPIPDESP